MPRDYRVALEFRHASWHDDETYGLLREFGAAFGELSALPTIDNPKGELQELLQARSPEAPEYHVISATGPDHDRVFECTVHHGGVELARGSGKSKKAAESDAALAALKKIQAEAIK